MIENIIPLLGKSIESDDIKKLFVEYGFAYPKKTTCTANNDRIKGKFEKNGIIFYFGRGANSRYLKPVQAKTKGAYVALFSMIECTKKCTIELPFGVQYDTKPDELTAMLGTPKVVDFMGKTTTWRKNYTEKHEFIVCDNAYTDGTSLRSITLGFIYEPDLFTEEDYAKAGL